MIYPSISFVKIEALPGLGGIRPLLGIPTGTLSGG
jgi:hypothetical protein